MAAEAQAVCESGIDSGISVALNTVVKIALGVGNLVAHCCVDKVLVAGKSGNDGFNASCCAQKMTCHGLGGVDSYLSCSFLAQSQLDSGGLVLVVKTCRGSVSVDIVNILRLQTCFFLSQSHACCCCLACG